MDHPPLKVLHVIETLSCGGAERLLVCMLPELEQQSVITEVAVLRPPFTLKSDLEAAGITVHLLAPRRKWALLRAAHDLARLASAREVDVLHAHLYFPTAITALTKILKYFNGVTHTSFHNLAYSGANRKTWKLALRKQLMRYLVTWGIDQPQAVSHASAMHYAEAFGLQNIAVIHNAFNISLLETINVPQGDALVLPGRLVPEKGHMDLITALAEANIICPPVIFAGEGPLRSQLEHEIARTGMPITITGELNHVDMLKTIAAAKLVVIPSRYEGFGLTALEALGLGRTVVASTAGGIPEVLGDLGYQVPPADPSALRTAIEMALNDSECAHTQQSARRARANQFDVQVIAKQQICLYKQTYRLKGSI